jgi:putative flippase GtrA
MKRRGAAFVAVGSLGFIVQLLTLGGLTVMAGWPYIPAAALGVELAVLNNFFWHQRWTWHDRMSDGHVVNRVARYHASTGLTSVGNVLMTAAGVELLGLHPIAATAAAVVATSFSNFILSDRWVFRSGRTAPSTAVVAFLLVARAPCAAAAADLTPEALAAWDRLAAEARARNEGGDVPPYRAEPEGGAVEVPNGTVHIWHGSITLKNMTVDRLVKGLQHPGTPPPQEGVLEARVLGRSEDGLRVYLKLIQRTIITVTYDTEHEMAFIHRSPTLVTSQSVSTKINEVDGRDRGFLWRLNSYWRYQQEGANVRVDLESLSLSREVPFALRTIVGPIAGRIARESVTRTLTALQRHFQRAETALRVTPAETSAVHNVAASAAAPGVSPCTQRVSNVPLRAIATPRVATSAASVTIAPGFCRDISDPSGS